MHQSLPFSPQDIQQDDQVGEHEIEGSSTPSEDVGPRVQGSSLPTPVPPSSPFYPSFLVPGSGVSSPNSELDMILVQGALDRLIIQSWLDHLRVSLPYLRHLSDVELMDYIVLVIFDGDDE